uniref:VWFD domain-containing protein n=2 Tax=Graphocephala atropunctata TaxID=36148 RepID=A0A1B6MQL4_9HEMI
MLEGRYQEVSKIPQVHYVKNAVTQIYQKIKWFWGYAKLSERLRDAMKQYFENMKATLDDLEKQLDRDEGELRSEYNYNAENHSLTFTQELPFEWRAFNQLPDYNMDVNSNPLSFPAQEYSNMVQTMANYLWQDAKLLPYLLPPFGAEAIISGNSFITFDNTFYHFRGGCGSYLLASDLYHNTFSLLAKYNQENKRDLLLITGDLEILVKNNLEVHVNGKLEDLPLKLSSGKHLTLERKVHSVLIKSGEGFSLECSSYQDMCKFHLDGWYMGKTAGLLGTYNHEPSDDFVRPDRQPSGNIGGFINSWSVESKQCDTESSFVSVVDSGDSRHYEMCEMFFSSQSSPFFPCFHVVDPKSFSEMCLSKANHDSTCSAVMAYLTKCTTSGVQLWMPEFCVDSLISEASMLPQYVDVLEVPAKMSADVVFIMEEADCVNSEKLNLTSLLANLNTDLIAKGLTDNKFALISFNSRDAQIHTVNGDIWTDNEKKMTDVVSRLETSEGPPQYSSALKLAADLPYRPGASKAAVLIHCSDCPHTENYGALLERLLRTDITLHVLQRAHLAGRKGKGISKVIGLEKSGAYPRKRLFRDVSPDPQLLNQVSAPQDLCTPLVLGTNGTLFELDVIRKGGKAWSGRVADGTTQLYDWQQCENSVGEDNVPVWRCRKSYRHTLKDWDPTALHEYMDSSRAEDLYPEYVEEDR